MVFHNANHKSDLMTRVQYLKNGQSICSLCGQTYDLSTGVSTLSCINFIWDRVFSFSQAISRKVMGNVSASIMEKVKKIEIQKK